MPKRWISVRSLCLLSLSVLLLDSPQVLSASAPQDILVKLRGESKAAQSFCFGAPCKRLEKFGWLCDDGGARVVREEKDGTERKARLEKMAEVRKKEEEARQKGKEEGKALGSEEGHQKATEEFERLRKGVVEASADSSVGGESEGGHKACTDGSADSHKGGESERNEKDVSAEAGKGKAKRGVKSTPGPKRGPPVSKLQKTTSAVPLSVELLAAPQITHTNRRRRKPLPLKSLPSNYQTRRPTPLLQRKGPAVLSPKSPYPQKIFGIEFTQLTERDETGDASSEDERTRRDESADELAKRHDSATRDESADEMAKRDGAAATHESATRDESAKRTEGAGDKKAQNAPKKDGNDQKDGAGKKNTPTTAENETPTDADPTADTPPPDFTLKLCRFKPNLFESHHFELAYVEPAEWREPSRKRSNQWVCYGPQCLEVASELRGSGGEVEDSSINVEQVSGFGHLMGGVTNKWKDKSDELEEKLGNIKKENEEIGGEEARLEARLNHIKEEAKEKAAAKWRKRAFAEKMEELKNSR
uniref:Uncharacterized protein n=1 Tax=Chromera velia CCMP2878 TaxID=1169474 RepID=A0A0G4IBY1_9ALVE|eukprot:Cvel_2233.t1-p1 / transcript=Cvel_2233.t1 / gene=Cvel_2233 / organism=Chromera_velia_CCMP2878 / gene_product=hypothetical protein / transcript_product=hypothetical protein / location=Cvel_scaffold86:34424-36959(-) / protein_length=532 / sequence_SO=supercontig / SO=protein_coding / is_pseudo=false